MDKELVQKPIAVGIAQDPVIGPGHDYTTVTDKISELVLTTKIHKEWVIGFLFSASLASLLGVAMYFLLFKGIGVWAPNVPVGWGFDIINFVWWIGIGHAGTLISAILLLLKQEWRTSINRFAEAMTLFAVACAGMYPLMHTGRPWLAYWMLPYPNTMGMWPQPRSPLLWDVFAVSTYATVSALFWFVGLIPDLATLRDKAKHTVSRYIFGALSMGWRGSADHWQRYEMAYLLLAGLSTPLVVSVHTIVSFDFAIGIIPGWHTTIFPPYFVAGAIFAGFAMVLTLAIPMRAFYKLEDFITMHHIENMCKVMLATGIIVVYGYFLEVFFGWYSANEYEKAVIMNRFTGPYAWSYWALIFCNGLAPQILWWKKYRRNLLLVWIISNIVSVGMWLERWVIIVVSLHRDFIPASWGYYTPTIFDEAFFAGTIGLFLTLMFLFVRLLPSIAMFEMKLLVPAAKARPESEGGH
ncbi:MAG: polysulfide reductase NrfD [Acidobacteria bacterium]|nr:polysulfide reductase NrfD [Acidobacteriota bacterium]